MIETRKYRIKDRNAVQNLRGYALEIINPVGTSGLNDRGVLCGAWETMRRATPENEVSENEASSKTEGKEAAKSLA